jgi:hypothetical protein
MDFRAGPRRFSPQLVGTLCAFVALILLSPGGAIAAPTALDCTLTELVANTGREAENRSITVVLDEEARSLTVYQDGSAQVLSHITLTQSTMNGYVKGMSLGIDRSSLSVVFQIYKPNSTSTEFGSCTVSAKPPPG